MGKLLERLRSRKLGQWAVAYLAGAWLVMQLVEVLGERWAWPLELQRGIDLLLLAGFFLTLVLAWYHAERGLRRVSGPELLIIAALLGITGILLNLSGISRLDRVPAIDLDRASLEGDASESPSGLLEKLDLILPDSAPMALLGDAPLGIGRHSVAFAPDGSAIAYAALRGDGPTHLCLRSMGSYGVSCFPGTDGVFSPSFSPDGAWIAYFSSGLLLKVPRDGGEPVVLCEAPNAVGGNWIGRDRIVWAGQDGTELFLVGADGGEATRLALDSDFAGVENTNALLFRSPPSPLPGDDAVLYSNNRETFALSLSTREVKLVLRGAESPSYLDPDILLFTRGSDLMATRFSVEDLTVVGDPVLLEEGVRVESQGSAQVAVSQDGTVAYAAGEHAAAGRFAWVNLAGRPFPLTHSSEVFSKFQISPSGDEVAAGVLGVTWDVWIYDIDSSLSRRLTRQGNNERPAWSADGEEIFYRSDRGGARRVFAQRADGSGSARLVLSGAVEYAPEDVGPSGDLLSYDRVRVGDWDLFVHQLGDSARSTPVWSEEGVTEALARFSPNGEWIAFASDELGQYEVYLGRADGSGRRFQVSAEGGEEPVWSPSGQLLFFRNGQTLLSVEVSFDDDGGVTIGTPRPLFSLEGWVNTPGHSYDLSPAGDRFLVVLRGQEVSAPSLRVLKGVHTVLSSGPRD